MRRTMILLAGCGFCVLAGGAIAVADSKAPKGSPAVTFQPASATASRGFEQTVVGEKTMYVEPRSLFTSDDVLSAKADRGNNGSLVLRLSPDPYAVLMAHSQATQGTMIAISSGSKTLAIGSVSLIIADGTITLSGLSSADAERIAGMIPEKSTMPTTGGATVTVVPRQTAIMPGDAVTADVFVAGASDLRLYQVAVDATGGTAGKMNLENMVIDKSRADYVFGTQQLVDAVDMTQGRMGGVLFEGGVNVEQPMYVGTYTFRSTGDSTGTFYVQVRVGRDSFMQTTTDETITYRAGQPAMVTVGAVPTPRPVGRPTDK